MGGSLECGGEANLACENCNVLSYCSPECRDQDKLPLYKPFCEEFVDGITNINPPSQLADDIPTVEHPPQLAVLLSVDSNTPEFVTLQLNAGTQDYTTYIQPKIEEYVPNYWLRPEYLSINDEKGRLHLYAEKTDLRRYHEYDDLPKPNNCLTTIMGGKEQFKWRGPIIIRPEIGRDFEDADLSVLSTVIKNFITQDSLKRNKNEDENPGCLYQGSLSDRGKGHENRLRARGLVKGVMISCLGDMGWWLGQEQFCQALLGPENNIWGWSNHPHRRSQRSSILLLMGLPVHLKQMDPHNSWAAALRGINDPDGIFESYRQAVPGKSLGENIEQYYLRVEAGIHVFHGDYGKVPLPLEGPVLIVREDKRDITPHQVEALAFFCRYVAHPKIRELKALELTASWRMLTDNEMTLEQKMARAETRERLADEWLSREKFEEFLGEFKKMKIDEGYETWAEVKSPFAARAW